MCSFENLKNIVLENSAFAEKGWAHCIEQWSVSSIIITHDNYGDAHCLCGHAIKYAFTIHNNVTGKTLSPIGSECIQYFNRDSATETVDLLISAKALVDYASANDNKFDVAANTTPISKALVEAAHEHGFFKFEAGYEFVSRIMKSNHRENLPEWKKDRFSKTVNASVYQFAKSLVNNELSNDAERYLTGKNDSHEKAAEYRKEVRAWYAEDADHLFDSMTFDEKTQMASIWKFYYGEINAEEAALEVISWRNA